MARDDLFPTDHLREKMKERDVSWGEIIDVVNYYENAYGPDEKGRMTFQKGDLCVVADNKGAITTVLLRQEKTWTDTEMKIIRDNMEELGRELQRGSWSKPKPKTKKPHSYYKRKKAQKRKNNER